MIMRAHILAEDGEILNTIMAEALADNMVDADLVGGQIGDRIINGVLVPRDATPPTEPVSSPDIDELQPRYDQAVRQLMDGVAVQFGFTDMAEAVSYADEPAVAEYQEAGQALRAWRSLARQAYRALIAEVRVGTRPVPTEAEMLDELPAAPVADAAA